MDSLELEESHDVTVVTDPGNAHRVYDSTTGEFHGFNGWAEASDAFHLRLQDGELATVRKYIHPSNKYYLIHSQSFETRT